MVLICKRLHHIEMDIDISQVPNYKCVKGRFSKSKGGLKLTIEYYNHGNLVYKIKNHIVRDYNDILDLIQTIMIELDDDDFTILSLLFITYALSIPS